MIFAGEFSIVDWLTQTIFQQWDNQWNHNGIKAFHVCLQDCNVRQPCINLRKVGTERRSLGSTYGLRHWDFYSHLFTTAIQKGYLLYDWWTTTWYFAAASKKSSGRGDGGMTPCRSYVEMESCGNSTSGPERYAFTFRICHHFLL